MLSVMVTSFVFPVALGANVAGNEITFWKTGPGAALDDVHSSLSKPFVVAEGRT